MLEGNAQLECAAAMCRCAAISRGLDDLDVAERCTERASGVLLQTHTTHTTDDSNTDQRLRSSNNRLGPAS